MASPSGSVAGSNASGDSGAETAAEGWRERFLVSDEYSKLWFAQVISALGDWVGLFAITALAITISGNPAAATALVLLARVAPSPFLAPFMGVLVDRFDRRMLMVISDVARAAVFVMLPWVNTLWGLIFASFLLEVFTLIWSPSKEALTPRLVPRSQLAHANSLAVLAAYATMPLAGMVQFLLKKGNDALAGVSWLDPLGFSRSIGDTQALAFYFNSITFLVTAFIVGKLIKTSGRPERVASGEIESGPRFKVAISEIREGWKFIWENPIVRAVNIGLAAGLLGGAMLVPLGPVFAEEVLGDLDFFSLYITALGVGVAVGVAVLTALQAKLPKSRVFVAMLFFAGVSVTYGVSMSTFFLSVIGVLGMGIGAGAVYILGFTLLQEHTDDDLRGRTFSTFLLLVRFCVLGAILLGPVLATIIDPIMGALTDERTETGAPAIEIFGHLYAVPGVRVALWIGGLLIIAASVLAARSIKMGFRDNLRALGTGMRRSNGLVDDHDHTGETEVVNPESDDQVADEALADQALADELGPSDSS
jgi:dTMP kinase